MLMVVSKVLKLRQDVKIVPLALEHAANMYLWMCDPVVSKNLGLRSEPSEERTSAWIAHALEDSSILSYAVLLAGKHVGNVVLDRIDDYLNTARLSVYIGESSARQSGVGLTGMYLVLSEVFQSRNFYKVWLTVHTRNFAAINTYRKLGFALEGILRGEFRMDKERVDVLYMGLVCEDFKRLEIV